MSFYPLDLLSLMPIQVSAKILGSVYFPGDIVECSIEFMNVDDSFHKTEILGWAFAQFFGQVSYDSNAIKTDSSWNNVDLHPSLGLPLLQHGHYMFISPQEVITSYLKLEPGEKKTFLYTCRVETKCLPPSYVGKFVKYIYVVSIGIVPSLSSVTRFDLKVPVKFANPYSGFLELQTKDIPLEGAIQSNCTLLGDNDYLRYRVQPHTDPSVSIWIQENMALKIQENSKPVSIQIQKNKEKVVQLTLEKTFYELGDTVYGVLDFEDRIYACYQIAAYLETEETILSNVCAPHRKNRRDIKERAYFHESTYHTLSTNFALYIPIDKVSPNFESDLVTVEWFIRFEFITSKAPVSSDQWNLKEPPNDVEKLYWRLPIMVSMPQAPYEYIHEVVKPNQTLVLYP